MNFHEIRFPTDLSFGSVGGPERRTEIVSLANGFEERNSPWLHSRRRYDAGMGLRSLDDIEVLIAFFEARQGQLFGFRWKDWSDYKSAIASEGTTAVDQPIGLGDGARTEFQLAKTYRSGAQSYLRPVTKPVPGTVKIAVAGAVRQQTVDWTADFGTGLIRLGSPPAAGVVVTAGFEFDVPVRFDTDRIITSVASFNAGEVPSVPVVEVRI